ncbi:uncharacterized protein F5Z01DRAFT_640569 [Emericellopsis atlantica]|uniref:Uncharacterized protein n=1 Tax=Emericellopsis atlantica TaxID=2614577 RepID=A0A9P8CKM1_9HYPO|nr:uncharacterized protein F5Z01DRAFT_640569 [Emericellopsis atlantica]KAG9250080.1 hypothetical protein F5Z01DRAFT_640569 [Emericellopsis atlantica]
MACSTLIPFCFPDYSAVPVKRAVDAVEDVSFDTSDAKVLISSEADQRVAKSPSSVPGQQSDSPSPTEINIQDSTPTAHHGIHPKNGLSALPSNAASHGIGFVVVGCMVAGLSLVFALSFYILQTLNSSGSKKNERDNDAELGSSPHEVGVISETGTNTQDLGGGRIKRQVGAGTGSPKPLVAQPTTHEIVCPPRSHLS